MKLKCKKCEVEIERNNLILEEIPLPNGGKHTKAICPECGHFIKFLSKKERELDHERK